ncbi:unnamed protein product [Sphagnum jensenii]
MPTRVYLCRACVGRPRQRNTEDGDRYKLARWLEGRWRMMTRSINRPYEGQAHHLNKAAMTLVRLLNDTDFSTFDTETAIDLTGEIHRLINRLEGTYQPRGNSDLYIPKAEHEAIIARALRTTHTSED